MSAATLAVTPGRSVIAGTVDPPVELITPLASILILVPSILTPPNSVVVAAVSVYPPAAILRVPSTVTLHPVPGLTVPTVLAVATGTEVK